MSTSEAIAVQQRDDANALPLPMMSPANPIEMLAILGVLRSAPHLRASWPQRGPKAHTVLHGTSEAEFRNLLRSLLSARPDIDWMPRMAGTNLTFGQETLAWPRWRKRKGWIGKGGVATPWYMISGRQIMFDTIEKAWSICREDLTAAADSFFSPRYSERLHSLGWDADAFRPHALSAIAPNTAGPKCVAAHLIMALRAMPAFAIRPGSRGHGWMWIEDGLYVDLPAPQAPTSWREWCTYLAHQDRMRPEDLVYRAARRKIPGAKGRHHMSLGSPRRPYGKPNRIMPQPWAGAGRSWSLTSAIDLQQQQQMGNRGPAAIVSAGREEAVALKSTHYMMATRVMVAEEYGEAPVECGGKDPAHRFVLRRAGGGRYDPLWTLHASSWGNDAPLWTFGASLVAAHPAWEDRVLHEPAPPAPWFASRPLIRSVDMRLVGATQCLACVRESVIVAYIAALGTLAPKSDAWRAYLRNERAIQRRARADEWRRGLTPLGPARIVT